MKTNHIYQGDCLEVMKTFPDGCVDLCVTSPPYFVGKEYENYSNYNQYLIEMECILNEVFRILKEGMFICLNVAHSGEQNTPIHLATLLERAGFSFTDNIIWNKTDVMSPRFGTTVSNPYPRWYYPNNVFEFILIYRKGGNLREKKVGEEIEWDFLLKLRNDIWEMRTEFKSKIGHPAPYPTILSSRLIKLYSYPNELVFDPFLGSGTTALSCKNMRRNYIGIEINPDYCKIAEERLRQEVLDFPL